MVSTRAVGKPAGETSGYRYVLGVPRLESVVIPQEGGLSYSLLIFSERRLRG